MLGREVNVPLSLMLGCESSIEGDSYPKYVRKLENSLQIAQQEARSQLKQNQRRQKRSYDVRLKVSYFEVGDVVYQIDSSTKIKQCNKLRSIFKGPYLVVEVLSPILFKIKNRKRESVVHHDRLKPCKDRNLPIWLKRMRHNLLQLNDTVEQEPDAVIEGFGNLFDHPEEHSEEEDIHDSALSPNLRQAERPTTRVGRQTRLPTQFRDYEL